MISVCTFMIRCMNGLNLDIQPSHFNLPNHFFYLSIYLFRSHGRTISRTTVDSRYLELGYLEFCELEASFRIKNTILIAFSNHKLASETFLQFQITRSANKFALRVIELVKNSPHNFEISRIDCSCKYGRTCVTVLVLSKLKK